MTNGEFVVSSGLLLIQRFTTFRGSRTFIPAVFLYCWTKRLVSNFLPAWFIRQLRLSPLTPSPSLNTAGQDATEAFFGLHRHEVLLRPQYKRLQVGVIKDEVEQVKAPVPGSLSKVPYAEPTWLSEGFHSPYYKQVLSEFLSLWCVSTRN